MVSLRWSIITLLTFQVLALPLMEDISIEQIKQFTRDNPEAALSVAFMTGLSGPLIKEFYKGIQKGISSSSSSSSPSSHHQQQQHQSPPDRQCKHPIHSPPTTESNIPSSSPPSSGYPPQGQFPSKPIITDEDDLLSYADNLPDETASPYDSPSQKQQQQPQISSKQKITRGGFLRGFRDGILYRKSGKLNHLLSGFDWGHPVGFDDRDAGTSFVSGFRKGQDYRAMPEMGKAFIYGFKRGYGLGGDVRVSIKGENGNGGRIGDDEQEDSRRAYYHGVLVGNCVGELRENWNQCGGRDSPSLQQKGDWVVYCIDKIKDVWIDEEIDKLIASQSKQQQQQQRPDDAQAVQSKESSSSSSSSSSSHQNNSWWSSIIEGVGKKLSVNIPLPPGSSSSSSSFSPMNNHQDSRMGPISTTPNIWMRPFVSIP